MTYTQPLLLVFSLAALIGLACAGRARRKPLLVAGILGLVLSAWPPVEWLAGDAYADSAGVGYGVSHTGSLTGVLSGRLFSKFDVNEVTLRPFVQAGVSERFQNRNEMSVGGTVFKYDDARTAGFARAGLDMDIGPAMQTYIAVRSDFSRDSWAVGGQVGISIKLN